MICLSWDFIWFELSKDLPNVNWIFDRVLDSWKLVCLKFVFSTFLNFIPHISLWLFIGELILSFWGTGLEGLWVAYPVVLLSSLFLFFRVWFFLIFGKAELIPSCFKLITALLALGSISQVRIIVISPFFAKIFFCGLFQKNVLTFGFGLKGFTNLLCCEESHFLFISYFPSPLCLIIFSFLLINFRGRSGVLETWEMFLSWDFILYVFELLVKLGFELKKKFVIFTEGEKALLLFFKVKFWVSKVFFLDFLNEI